MDPSGVDLFGPRSCYGLLAVRTLRSAAMVATWMLSWPALSLGQPDLPSREDLAGQPRAERNEFWGGYMAGLSPAERARALDLRVALPRSTLPHPEAESRAMFISALREDDIVNRLGIALEVMVALLSGKTGSGAQGPS